MPPKKTSSVEPLSERLQLAQIINVLSQKQDAFTKAVETLSEFNKETLNKLDMEISSKKIELTDLDFEFQRQKKENKIKIDQYFEEYRYDGAVKLIAEKGEVPIDEGDLEELRSQVESSKQTHEEEMEKIRKSERDNAKKNLESSLSRCDLSHKAETAELKATVNQQRKEIDTLQKTIDNLTNELAQQRQLTRDVAEAGRPAPVTVNSK